MNIDVKEKTITAKSEHDNYALEATGIKPNTVRIVTKEEYTELKKLDALSDFSATLVLVDVDTKDSIRRQILGVSLVGIICGHYQVVISFTNPVSQGSTA